MSEEVKKIIDGYIDIKILILFLIIIILLISII